jgi:hypothetical protein
MLRFGLLTERRSNSEPNVCRCSNNRRILPEVCLYCMFLNQTRAASMAIPQVLFDQMPLGSRKLIVRVSRQKPVNVLLAIH